MKKHWFMSIPFLCAAIWNQDAMAASLGKCSFDKQTQSFAGSDHEQAACLLRKVAVLGHVDKQPATLPGNLAGLIGQPVPVSKAKLRDFIREIGLAEVDLGGSFDAPLSRGSANSPRAPSARYFVIHDTSSPNFRKNTFPDDIDTSDDVNSLKYFKRKKPAKAHIFLNRRREIYVGHDFSVPWRATKLETEIGTLSKGLFLHVENLQPRRAHPRQPDGNAPVPGFTPAQYDRLALLYVAAEA